MGKGGKYASELVTELGGGKDYEDNAEESGAGAAGQVGFGLEILNWIRRLMRSPHPEFSARKSARAELASGGWEWEHVWMCLCEDPLGASLADMG